MLSAQASLIRLDVSGKVSGVQVNGVEPYAFTFTSGAVGVITNPQTPLNELALYPSDEPKPATVNPNVLFAGGVSLCSGGIYARSDSPQWCRNANVKRAAFCKIPYAWGCDTISIDTHGLFSWEENGRILLEYDPPVAIGYVVTATAAIVALILVDAFPMYTDYKWVPREVALLTVAVSVMSNFNWSFIIVAGISAGVTVAGARANLLKSSLRAALVVTIAESLTEYNIDATAVGLARVVAAVAVLIGAGARGSVWAFPWAIVRGIYPTVVGSQTLLDDRDAERWAVTTLIAIVCTFVGVAGSNARSWRENLFN